MSEELASNYRKLQIDTAKLLNLDAHNLTPAQSTGCLGFSCPLPSHRSRW
jgi:hypothetical protein